MLHVGIHIVTTPCVCKKFSALGFPEIGMEKIEKVAMPNGQKKKQGTHNVYNQFRECHYQSATQKPTESTIVTLFIASNVVSTNNG